MILEIWHSFRRLPGWVQLWIAVILVPVNLLPALFWLKGEAFWEVIALLSVGGMIPNLPIMAVQRGLSKAMSLPHIVVWTPLVVLLIQILRQRGFAGPWDIQDLTLGALLAVNLVSLAFDYVDGVKWWRGDRAIA